MEKATSAEHNPSEISPRHVILCLGMRRGGSTIQYNLVRSLIENLKIGRGIGFSNDANESLQLLRENQHLNSILVLKSYNYSLPFIQQARGELKILTIYRDLRDVYSSRKKKRPIEINEFIQETRAFLEGIQRLQESHRILSQKYEQLYENLEAAIKEIAAFIGLQVLKEDVLRIKEANSLSSAMAEIEKAFSSKQRFMFQMNRIFRHMPVNAKKASRFLGITPMVRRLLPENDIVSSTSRLHPDHISKSKGQPGRWRDELSQRESRQIEESFKPWMQKYGYL